MLLTFLTAFERDIIMFLAGAALMSLFYSAFEPFTRYYKGWRHERMWTQRNDQGELVTAQDEHPAFIEEEENIWQ